ncbi:MAG TPA: TetR/AcrR family transcriptional regulator [Solirubrobacterales bacterium]|nr:TetR/AcrR family transcriptional regulator [Solirubrobacterales bacterium]
MTAKTTKTKSKTTKTKWQRKREASRAALVRSAAHSFHERGYAATRVEDIVAGTGYTSGAFYFHFTDKAECFWTVVEHREGLRGEWWEIVLEGLDPGEVPLGEVLGRVFAHFDRTLEGLNEWVLVMVDFHQQHRGEGVPEARLAEVYRRWHEEMVSFAEALAERGWIDGGRDPDVLATQVFAFAEGLAVHARLYGIEEAAVQGALIEGLVRLLR